jgi:hypothetical protein
MLAGISKYLLDSFGAESEFEHIEADHNWYVFESVHSTKL